MGKLLLVFGTTEGHTATIAAHIAEMLRLEEHHVTVKSLAQEAVYSISDYDGLLVGSSIHAGQPHGKIKAFVQNNKEVLHTRPTAYFQVSLSTADPRPEKQDEAQGYADQFLQEMDWSPNRVALFGGALPFTRYGFFKRLLMTFMAKKPFGITDTSRDYDFTNWDQVEHFARAFSVDLKQAEGTRGFVEEGVR